MSALKDRRWLRVRAFVLERDRHRCYWCGGRATEGDHLLSREEGGQRYDPSNIVAACKRCNSSRGAELLQARAQGSRLGAGRRAPKMHRAEGAIRL